MGQKIVLTVDEQDLTFDIELSDYNAYVNGMSPTNKVAPSHNFLMRTIEDADRDTLKTFLKLPGAPLDIAGALLEEYQPHLNITVGKRKA